MTTTVTKYIGTLLGTEDYATEALWEAYLTALGNITAGGNDTIQIGLLTGGVYTESSIGGVSVVTDSTHTITLACATGASFNQNGSKLSNALRYNESNGVAIRITGTGANVIGMQANWILDGIQFQCTAAQTGALIAAAAGGNGKAKNCIFDTGSSSTTTTAMISIGSTFTGAFNNNLFIINRAGRSLYSINLTGATFKFEGNLIVNTVGSTVNCITNGSSSRFTATDNVAIGYTGKNLFSSSSAGATCTTNATDGTLGLGTGSSSITPSACFVSPTGTLDLRPLSSSPLIGAGTASGTNPTDMFGATRPSPPIIGPLEYASAGASVRGLYSASGVRKQFADADVGTGKKLLVLYNGIIVERSASEGVAIVLDNGVLREATGSETVIGP